MSDTTVEIKNQSSLILDSSVKGFRISVQGKGFKHEQQC